MISLAAGGDGYTMLGGARERPIYGCCLLKSIWEAADLTQYELIELTDDFCGFYNFSLPVETPQTNAAANDATTKYCHWLMRWQRSI